MYTLQLLKSPHDIVFSRNPIQYQFRVVPFSISEVNARLRVVVAVFVETYFNSGVFEPVWSGSEYPNNRGIATIDIQSILNASLEWHTPNLNLKKFHRCKKQSKHAYIRYQLVDNNGNTTDEVNTDTFVAIKGGLANEEWHPSNFFTTNVAGRRQTLHYWHDQELLRADETKFLFFTLLDPTEEKLIVNCNLRGNDTDIVATYEAWEQPINTSYGEVFCIPFNLTTLDVAANLPPGDILRSIDLWITDATTAEFTNIISLKIDHRPFYEVNYLYFRNSLGGIDTQAIVGEKEFAVSIDARKAEVVKRSELLGLFNIQNELPVSYSHQNASTQGHTGWIPKVQLDKLRDLLLQKQVFELYGLRYRPLHLLTDKVQLWKNTDKLYNLAIECAQAFNDPNYSREYTLTQSDTCPAVDVFLLSQEKGGYVHFHWELPEGYDKIHIVYNIDGGADVDVYYLGNTGDADIRVFTSFAAVAPKNVIAKARVVCNDEIAPFSYGPYTTSQNIDIANFLLPIAIADAVDIEPRTNGARTLKQNGTELNFLLNDIPRNVGALSGIAGIYDAVGTPTGTSANGANMAVLAGGKIQYYPTPASLLVTTEDNFYYKCQETLPGYGVVDSNLVKIVVPMKGQVPKVWVKYINTSDVTNSISFGIAGNYTEFDITKVIHLQFFADAACTIPIDTTGLGITIAYYEVTTVTVKNAIGNISSVTGPSLSASIPLLLVGSSMLFQSSLDWRKITGAGAGGCTVTQKEILKDIPNTIGVVSYVDWPL